MATTAQCGVDHDSQPELPPRVLEKLTTALLQVRTLSLRQLWWDRLTDEERNDLGGDFIARLPQSTDVLWMELHDRPSQPRAILELAHGLGVMADGEYAWLDREVAKVDPILPPETDPEAEIEEACRNHRLVLVQDGRRCIAYWDGQAIGRAWEKHSMSWDLLWKLADAARSGRTVPWDELQMCEDPRNAVCRCSRLKKRLSLALAESIDTVDGSPGTYELQLPPCDIRLLDYSGQGPLMLDD